MQSVVQWYSVVQCGAGPPHIAVSRSRAPPHPWYGKDWHGVPWHGMVRYGSVWRGMARLDGMVYGMMIWYGSIWYGMVCPYQINDLLTEM